MTPSSSSQKVFIQHGPSHSPRGDGKSLEGAAGCKAGCDSNVFENFSEGVLSCENGSNLLRPMLESGDDAATDVQSMQCKEIHEGPLILNVDVGSRKDDDRLQIQTWGLPWTPEEFTEMATRSGHPAMLKACLPDALADCISQCMRLGCAERMKVRAQTLKFWLRRSLQLKADEEKLHRSLDSTVAEVLRGKRITLLKGMLQAIQYSDIGVVDEFCSGSSLSGQAATTRIWPSKFTPATMTEEELRRHAALQRPSLSYASVVFFDQSGTKPHRKCPGARPRDYSTSVQSMMTSHSAEDLGFVRERRSGVSTISPGQESMLLHNPQRAVVRTR